ncbi:MAG TPA: type II toxin-antitoxin system VapC family toxin [Acidimicrobiales bacterium]
MTLYVDTSALLKRYIDEPDSDRAEALLASDPDLVTGRHTLVEVRRNLARLLDGPALLAARDAFSRDLEALALIELDANTCERAAALAEQSGVRTLDALHLGAASRLGSVSILTYDVRQAQVARAIGLTVVGG